MSDDVFDMPDITRATEMYPNTCAVKRHYMVIREAMKSGDRRTVGNRQLRLLKAGFEIPVTLQHCCRLLEKYNGS